MSDEKNVNPNDVKSESKAPMEKSSFFKVKAGEFKGEFGKIIWPSRKDLTRETMTVIITSLLFGAVICGLDAVLSFVYGAAVKMIFKVE